MAIEAQLADGRVLEFPDGTDPAVIQSTVKRLIAGSQPAPTQKPTQAAEPKAGYDFGAAMAADIAPAETPIAPVVGKEPGPAKAAPYKDRREMLDDAVNLIEEGADLNKMKQSLQKMGVKWGDVVKHGQGRGSDYFKQQAPMAAPVPAVKAQPAGEIKATPETEFFESPVTDVKYVAEAMGNMFKRVDASLGDVATSFLFQTGVTDADAAGRLLARNAKQRAAAAPSQAIREGMEEIGNAKTYGDAITALASNPRATFTMLVESVAVSLPAMAPALVLGPAGVLARSGAAGLSSGGLEYGSVMADVLQDKGVNMLDANAVSKALSDPKIIAEIKDKGAKRGLIVGAFDALSMGIAGRFLKPARALIAEGKLAGSAATKATMAAWGKELTTQMAGGAGGEFAAQKATGENKPADVLLEALAEGVTAPLEARSNLRDAKMAEQQAVINAELAAEKKPTDTNLGELGKVRPSDDLKEAPPLETTPEKVRADRIAALTEINIQQGIPAENAENIATRKVDAQLKAENKDAAIKVPENRVEQITQDLIASGVPPQQAVIDAQNLAQEEVQADELARVEAQGETNVGQTITEPSRDSVQVAGQPSAEPPAGGVGVAEPSGVVPAGQDVTGVVGGERLEPTAIEEPVTETPKTPETLAPAAIEEPVTETEGAPLGTETSETIEAAQEGQTPPTTGAVTGKRGRPPAPQKHVVAQNPEGGFEHVTDGAVTATYKNRKQATAAVNLAKAQDRGDAARATQYQAELDKALASQGRGRPAKAPSEDGTVEVDQDTKVELAALESALETYNSPAEKTSIANAAMYINDAANDPSAPKAVRERAKQMLEEDIDPKDIPKKMRSSEAKVAKADTGFSGLVNGSQAIAQIIKTGNLFQRFVAQRIRNFVVGVKFVVVEKGDATPASILAELEGARGLFVMLGKERTIYVRGSSFGDQQGINNITVLHELLHAATASRITAGLLKGFKNASLQKFMREMDGIMKRAEQEYKDLAYLDMVDEDVNDIVSRTYNDKTDSYDIFKDPNEFLAYGMSSPEFQKFLMRVQGVRKEPTLFSTFVSSIRDLFGIKQGEATAFTDLVDITDKMLDTRLTAVETGRTSLQQKGPEDLFDEEADSKVKRTAAQLEKDAKIAKEKVRLSREGEEAKNVELMQLARDPKAVREILANVTDALGYAKLQATVRLPTFDFLAKWAADAGIPALNKANTQMQRMLGMSQKFLVGAEQIIGSMNRGFKEDPKLSREKFSEFVYATTLAEIDPSDTSTRVRSKELDDDYKALGPVGQRMYKKLRDYYESVIELYSDLLDEQINNLQGMTTEEKKNLMAVLRKTFEAESRIKPFFPLVRRGDFFLAIGSGEQRLFYLFETRAERNEAAKKLAAERGKSLAELVADKEFEQGNDLKELRAASQNSSEMLKEVFAAIDAKDLGSPEAKEGLKDAVYQIYLTTMPEQSFRRQFTHRKGRAGFSTDLQRNIATTASKQSIQLARLKYGPLLRNAMSEARNSIAEREELSPFVQEAEKRIDMALSGAHGSLSESVAGVANKASYFWYLSSAASALIQPSSIFISGLPVLAGNYNNATGAATELAKMTTLVNQYSVFRPNVDGTTSISAPSIANNKTLPADERKAIGEMTARGVSESTYASLVWGYKSMSTEQFEGVVGKGKRLANLMVGALMHNTERLSREAVYLAAYRLGKKQGLDYDTAVQKAVDSTNEALGNYDVTNRPRFMQQGIGKIAFQFKTYPLQMSLLLLTNFKKMLPFLNKEGKKEAATKFFGMMGTSFLLAGAANMALINPIMGLAGWAWSQLSLDDDWPEELKNIDFFTWFFEVLLPDKLGDVTLGGVPVSDLVKEGPFNALTGWAIGARIGLADLFGRDSKETKTSRESAIAFMLDHFGGPTASLMLGFADAYDAYAMGDYQKMLERMLPAVVRNLVVANKYADEGMQTGRGKELVGKDDVKTGEIIGQAIGFRPDILAATQGPAFKYSGIEQKINNQRNLILNKLDFQRRKETDAGDDKFADIIENEVSKFNKKNPSYALDADSIYNSLLKKAEQRASSRAGVNVTEKNVSIVGEAADKLQDRLDRRATEMAAKRKAEKIPGD